MKKDALKSTPKLVSFPTVWVDQIEKIVAGDPLRNFQDFVRMAVQEKLEQLPAEKKK